VHEWVQDETPDAVVDAFDVLTWLGANHVVFPGGLVLAVVARRRSSRVASAVLVSVALRPVVQLLLKPTVGRARPTGLNYAFPSGHVAAAVSLYLLLPFVAAAWGAGPRGRRIAAAVAGALILVVAASRVILGVHWLSDVTGSMLLGVLWLPVLRRLTSGREAGEGVPDVVDRAR